MIDKFLAGKSQKTGGFWYRLLRYSVSGPRYGKSFDKRVAQKIEENFKNGIPSYELSLDIDHGKDPNHPGAYGKITKVEARDDGLWVYSEPDQEGVELIKRKKFKYMSATYAEKYMDKKTGKEQDRSLGVLLSKTCSGEDMEQIVYF